MMTTINIIVIITFTVTNNILLTNQINIILTMNVFITIDFTFLMMTILFSFFAFSSFLLYFIYFIYSFVDYLFETIFRCLQNCLLVTYLRIIQIVSHPFIYKSNYFVRQLLTYFIIDFFNQLLNFLIYLFIHLFIYSFILQLLYLISSSSCRQISRLRIT